MKLRHALLAFAAGAILAAGPAAAVEMSIVSGDTGNGLQVLRDILDQFEKNTGNKVTIVPMPSSTTDQFGQYKLWLAAQNSDIDVYQTDVIWAPQLANQLVDLTEATKDVVGAHFPSIIESQTVNGKLVALPIFTDAPALYYRKDLLDKYGAKVPTTWAEMADTAFATGHAGKTFAQFYGTGKNATNGNGNALGKCVSAKASAKTAAQQSATAKAAKACKTDAALKAKIADHTYKTYGACVSAQVKKQLS